MLADLQGLLDFGPLGPVAELEAFQAGVWNGSLITAADIVSLATNFAALTAGSPPWYVPYVSVNHNDEVALKLLATLGLSRGFGDVVKVAVNAAGKLVVDLADVPQLIRDWMSSGSLTGVSIEYWIPGTFRMPDGTFNTSIVLKCVSLLGDDAPGVKGLSAPKNAKFRDASAVLKFSDLPPATRPGAKAMDERNQLIKAMSDMGVDTKTFTDAVPIEAIKAMADAMHKAMADVKKYQDEAKARGDDNKGKEDDEDVKKYRDRLATATSDAEKVLAQLRQQAEASAAASKASIEATRAARIRAFRDEMCGPNAAKVAYMTPAQFDATVEPLLSALDCSTVRKFADGKTDGTALDEQMAKIRAANSAPIKKFGDQFADGQGNGNKPGLTPERRAELLSKTPEGKAILAREKAAAK